jgi:kynurenine formamidase
MTSRSLARRRALAAIAGLPALSWLGSSRAAAAASGAGIPAGYRDVDPRTARRIPLWHELSDQNPIFPGDPRFKSKIFTTIPESGYLLEQVTSLGTHSGTHISAPSHFIADGAPLNELDEGWTLMPLAVIDVRDRIAADGGDFSLGVPRLRQWEARHGRLPAGGCLLLLTGFAERFVPGTKPGPGNDYFDPAPGFTGEAVEWVFDERGIRAVGSDTFGPDATSDEDFTATSTALAKGGITVENVGPGLSRMRQHGDWVSINGPRPSFSGFQMGITGFTGR